MLGGQPNRLHRSSGTELQDEQLGLFLVQTADEFVKLGLLCCLSGLYPVAIEKHENIRPYNVLFAFWAHWNDSIN